ncbi:IclR family transcriptional regulator [Phreatobacter stygius]|uniref:IclR family transcriptional regulator n=2 Tax=Phreatobacter stygius TaxID=1940610 RepID=A0A4D7BP38_9HYPH|nr:IclR family transcriptional regulator [Phreatobacter stygius]
MAREAGYGLTDVARLTGLTRPTAHRILLALIDEGLVEQKPATRRYAVGEQIQLLALSRPRRSPLLAAAEPLLDELTDSIGDTLFLTQRAGLDTVCVARRLGAYPVQVLSLSVGDRRPLGVSSSGLALLARLPDDEANDLLAQNAPRLTSYGATLAQASAWVQEARKLGYAVRDRGLVPGTRALSVTIRDRSGEAFAAITCAGVIRRMSPARMEAIAEDLRAAAQAVERLLARA